MLSVAQYIFCDTRTNHKPRNTNIKTQTSNKKTSPRYLEFDVWDLFWLLYLGVCISYKYFFGFTGAPVGIISPPTYDDSTVLKVSDAKTEKCKCGPVEFPVFPLMPIF